MDFLEDSRFSFMLRKPLIELDKKGSVFSPHFLGSIFWVYYKDLQAHKA